MNSIIITLRYHVLFVYKLHIQCTLKYRKSTSKLEASITVRYVAPSTILPLLPSTCQYITREWNCPTYLHRYNWKQVI